MAIFFLYLLQLLIRPQDFSPSFLGWPTAWLTIVPGIFIGLFKYSTILRQIRIPQYYLMIGFLIVIYTSTMINAGFDEAGLQFDIFLKRIMTFYMVFLLLSDDIKLRNGLFIFMVLASVLGIHSILQVTTGIGFAGLTPLIQYNPPRAVWCGVWDGSNTFGVLFVITIPICLEFLLSNLPLIIRLIAGICTPFVFLGLYFVDSRGDTISAMVMSAVYCLMKFSKKTNVVIFIVAFVFIGTMLPSRMANVSTSESSAHERTWVWEQGISLLKDNPVLGIGSGQFIKKTESGLIAHSNHVSVFTELGLLGYFIFISINWFTFKGLMAIITTRMNYKWIIRLQPSFFEDFSLHNSISDLQMSLARILFCSMIGFIISTLFIVLLTDLQFLLLGFSVASFIVVKRTTGYNILRFTWLDLAGIIGSIVILISVYRFIAL
ncbi:MAG: hypothetical protein JXB49_30180 [Bacteroidales bacterium]|nr:hypothetical protein [Bacteroidales bacterium]